MSALSETVAVLLADAGVQAKVSDRVYPLQAGQDQTTPYVIVTETVTDPQNHLLGPSGLDRCEVDVNCWARTFSDAEDVAAACRTAMESAGHLCIGRITDFFDGTLDPSFFRSGRIYQVWP